jgi:SAM-dependent methyltransferase
MSTDQAWKDWGEKDPYFGVLTAEKFRKRNLTDEAKAEFLDSGRGYVDYVLAMLRKHIDPGFAPRRVLDFGCGVGRLVIPFARLADEVVGVDVSEGMLAEARRNCEAAGVGNVKLVPSDDALSALDGQFDLVHSVLVFQHIDPQRGREIFRRMVQVLAPGGAGALQFTYAKSRYAERNGQPPQLRQPLMRSLKSAVRRALRKMDAGVDPEMQMNVYPLNELLFILQSSGVREVHTEFADHGGELAVSLYFRRP